MMLHSKFNTVSKSLLSSLKNTLTLLSVRNFKIKRIASILLMMSLLLPLTFHPVSAAEIEMNKRIAAGDYRDLPVMTAMILAVDEFITSLFSDEKKDSMAVKAGVSESLSNSSSSELIARVKSIKLSSQNEITMQLGQILTLSAIPLDAKGNAVHGLSVKWHSGDAKAVYISEDGQVKALKVGIVQLTAKVGNISKALTVKVESIRKSVSRSTLDDEFEFESLFRPENSIGSPPGKTERGASVSSPALRTREKPGSANFGFDVPLVGLQGRGQSVSLALNYNSRVWNLENRPIGGGQLLRFDVDRNWLAPGFSLGYGYLDRLDYYVYGLTAPDGTRYRLKHKQQSPLIYESEDGSFIRLEGTVANSSNEITSGTVTYSDGTKVMYSKIASSSSLEWRLVPVKITDSSGNYIQITYLSDTTRGEIDYIKDTMNRYIRFYYEGNGTSRKLVTITVPAFNDNNSELQVARFYYADISINPSGSFSIGATTVGTRRVLKYIYFPGTSTGYRFNYSEPYGSIREIQQLRGITVSTTDKTQTGTVTSDGQNAASSVYNYPTTTQNLSNVPTYSTRTDDWVSRTSSQPVYSFSFNEEDGYSSVTAPDGVVTRTYTIQAEGGWNDGLIDKVETRTGSQLTVLLSKTDYTWQQGPNGLNPRLEKIEFTNEADQTRAVVYDNYDSYNNVGSISERDFAVAGTLGTELRRTEITYETGSGWVNNRLVRLQKTVKVIANSVVVSQTDYEYDNNGADASQNLVQRDQLVMHDNTYDPFSTSTYNINTRFRGNVTMVTANAKPSLGGSDPNKSVETIEYDVPGNLVEETANCCNKRMFTYNKTYEYAFPVEEKKGNQGQLTTSATYDFNTGLMKTATDENNQTTIVTYDASSLRQTRIDRPDGGYTTTEYYDSLVNGPSGRQYSYIKTTTKLDSTREVSSWNYFDGRGATVRTFGALTASGYANVTDIEYDVMGRVLRSSEPYYASGISASINPTGNWTTSSYDLLGRTIEVTLPDNTEISASYNGTVTSVTDQAGRQRRQITDALGRVIRVDEPDANGNLDSGGVPVQPTSYEYDLLGNLTKVTQTTSSVTQERIFKYDSLARLTHEKQPEMNATLNDAGEKVTSGGLWTGVYVYDSNSLLTDGYDTRGVRAQFTYDGLNRVKTATFTGETNYQTPTVTYTYDEERTGYFNKGQLTKVETESNSYAPSTTQIYDYDKLSRVVKQQQTIGANGSIAAQTYSIEYGFNLAGQLISQKYPSGRAVNFTVDDAGRLANIYGGGRTYANGFSYAGHGGLLSMNYGNGATENFSFNNRLQLAQQSLVKNDTVIQRYDYAYGQVDQSNGNVDTSKNAGQIAKIEGYIGGTTSSPDKQWQQRFSYDIIGRLSQSSEYRNDSGTLSLTYKSQFDYDRWGNRYRKAANNTQSLSFTAVEESDVDKATNRFSSTSNTTYNEGGQVVTDNKFRNLSYRHDANGRQIWTQNSSGQGSENKAVYDAGGNRVATQINGDWRYFVYDLAGNLLAEYGQSQITTDKIRYYMQDHQASIRVVMKNDGSVISRTDYQAFGEEIGAGVGRRTTSQGYNQTDNNRQRYAMTERDEATGLEHTWFRKYDNKAGRWTSADPYKGSMILSNPQSFNRYTYVNNDSVNLIDPSGLCQWFIYCIWINGVCFPQMAWLSGCEVNVRSGSSIGGSGGWVGDGGINGDAKTKAVGIAGGGASPGVHSDDSGTDRNCVSACLADIAINLGLEASLLGLGISLVALFSGVEINPVQHFGGYEELGGSYGPTDMADQIGNLNREVSQRTASEAQSKIIGYERKMSRRTANAKKIARLAKRIKPLKALVKAGKTSVALSIAAIVLDKGVDAAECVAKCQK